MRLLSHLVWWDMVSLYFGSWAGLLWNFVLPAVVILAYLAIFELTPGFRFGGGREVVGGFGINLVAGLIPWMLFQEGVSRASSAFIDNRHVLSQIPLPAPLFPLANVGSALVRHVVALGLFAAILIWSGLTPTKLWLMVPVLAVPLLLLTAGCALVFACLTVLSRDVAPTVGVAMLPLFFGTPIIYPTYMVPETLRMLMDLNPLSGVVVAYRDVLITGRMPMPGPVLYSFGVGALLVLLGVVLVRRIGPELAERL
ncbi:MAG: ABC transporter permease [Deltaproteobacteria bacterium]|nr:ABC transporter permease [Deltaproteobacteria bacterium]